MIFKKKQAEKKKKEKRMKLEDLLQKPKHSPPKILVYGSEGIGKTTFCNSKKSLFLLTENGMSSIPKEKTPMVLPVAKNLETFYGYLEAIEASESPEIEYNKIVVDSLSGLEKIIHKNVCKKNRVSNISNIGWQAGFEEAAGIFSDIILRLCKISEEKKKVLIFVGHSKVEKNSPPFGEPFDQFSVDLHKKASAHIVREMDVILFINYSFIVDSESKKAIGDGSREILTKKNPAYLAKCRYSGVPGKIDFDDKNKGINYFLKLIKNSQKKINK